MKDKPNVMTYKGFTGSQNISQEDSVLFGKIECINDLITYEADTVAGLITAFHEAVDDYLITCKELGKKPDKPMSGTFNVRVGSDLHRKAFITALKEGVSLNDYIKTAISEKVNAPAKMEVHWHLSQQFIEESFDFKTKSTQAFRRDFASAFEEFTRKPIPMPTKKDDMERMH